MLAELLREPLESCLADRDSCLEIIRQVRDSYILLDRPHIGAEQVLELKFAALYWRRSLLERLCSDPPPAWLSADHNTLVDIVDALGIRVPDSLMAGLSRYLAPKTLHHLLALQGIPSPASQEFRAMAGPGVYLKMKANRDSTWPFSRWKRQPEFSNYQYSGSGVVFRGVHFKPGDVLLANVNIDGNGVYTILSDPTRFSSHSAVFAILEDEHRRWPAVIETYEKGVRAVPLNVFLGPKYCAYIEISRHRDLNDSHAYIINRSSLKLIDRVRGYNFNSIEDHGDYVSCCVVGRLLHKDAGLDPVSWKSRMQHPAIQANVKRLDYTSYDFFSPVDYLLDRNYVCAGWVDNNQFESLLARELVEGYFRELFINRSLNLKKFPIRSRFNLWGIRRIRQQDVMGRIIGLVEGFDHLNLPKGPDRLLAVITVVEAQLGRFIERTRRWLESLDDWSNYFSLDEFSRRPDVRQFLETEVKLRWLE